MYVFCLLAHKDKATLNPLDLDQWEFYVVPTAWLNEVLPVQKSVPLSFLKRHNIAPCGYTGIRPRVEATFNRP